MANEERQDLYNFVKTHYGLTGDGQVFFRCECQNPDNCSEWQHHPDIDAVIVEIIDSTIDPNMEATVEDFKYRFITWFWLSVNLVWGASFLTKSRPMAWLLFETRQYGQVASFLLDDGMFVLFLINLVWFVVWLGLDAKPTTGRRRKIE